jgi:beta-lactam-binding protein with PASTA domain
VTGRSQPGWLGVVLGGAAGFLVGVVLIVVLGGVVHDHTRTVVHTTTQTTTRTVTHTVQVAPADPNRVTVPDVVGAQLNDAEDQLSGLGLEFDEIGGGAFGVIDPSNWRVVDQHPRAGAHVDIDSTTVELDIERN